VVKSTIRGGGQKYHKKWPEGPCAASRGPGTLIWVTAAHGGCKERKREAALKRLLLLVTVAIILAMTLGTAVEALASDALCPPERDVDENITGTDGPDELRGCGGNDTIHGGAGNDAIHGNAQHDTLYGEDGDDRLFGGNGDDTLYGGNGNDRLEGGDGNDELYDTAPNDTDYLYGGAGNDFLNARDGDERDYLYGGTGTDQCWGETRDKYDSCERESRWTPSGNLVKGDGIRYPQ
jgi:Ca2+-binding RTX toxin-like protein